MTTDKLEREMVCVWKDYIHSRDPDLRERLLEHYMPMVGRVVDAMAADVSHCMEREDMLGWGRLGLLEAVMRFAPCRGMEFGSFCVRYIRRAVLDDMARFNWSRARRHSDRLRRRDREESLPVG